MPRINLLVPASSSDGLVPASACGCVSHGH